MEKAGMKRWGIVVCAVSILALSPSGSFGQAGKSLNKCQKAIANQGSRYIRAVADTVGKCLYKASTTVIVDGGNLQDVSGLCVKQLLKINRSESPSKTLAGKFDAQVGKACDPAVNPKLLHLEADTFTIGETRLSAANLGAYCEGFAGSGTIGSFDDWRDCLRTAADCQARQAIATQWPRVLEYLEVLGVGIAALPVTAETTDALIALAELEDAIEGSTEDNLPDIVCGPDVSGDLLATCDSDLASCATGYSSCSGDLSECTANYGSCSGDLATCANGYSNCTGDLTTCSSGTAVASDVAAGKTFSSSAGLGLLGTASLSGASAGDGYFKSGAGVNVTLDGPSFVVVLGLSLPTGNYLLSANAAISQLDGTGGGVECLLGDTGQRYDPVTTGSDLGTFLGHANLSAPGFATFRCRTSGAGDYLVADAAMSATQVASLNVQSGTCTDGEVNQGEGGIDCGGPCPACPTCDDGIQNQGEGGIDCDGPCSTVCETCSDGIQNQGEEQVDCGGPCVACPTCSDGIQNQGEGGIDCEGPCPAVCPTCNDGIQNQGEQGIDCQGPCPLLCINTNFSGNECSLCVTGQCEQIGNIPAVSTCTGSYCADGVQNHGETEIDCGGPSCPTCPTCSDGIQNQGEQQVDCGGPCALCPGTCSDGILNQDEERVDCGGSICPECPPTCDDGILNQGETVTDCGGPCPVCTCIDGIQNQGETGMDCGGPCGLCPNSPCPKNTPQACGSGVCACSAEAFGCYCQAPTCSDGVQNQGETLIDCGGPSCAACASCSDGIQNYGEEQVDCGGPCDACPSPTCSDGIRNQGEIGVDCGGPCQASCPPCGDWVQNQGEEGVDCGGPCTACAFGTDAGTLALFTLDTNVNDSSGNDRDAVLLGGVFETGRLGGNALRLTFSPGGGLDWSAYASELSYPFTIEMIVTPEDTTEFHKLFNPDDSSDAGWYYRGGGLYDYPSALLGSGSLPAGQLHYIALVFESASTTHAYVNGSPLGTTTPGATLPFAQAVFFHDDAVGAGLENFGGLVEMLRISSVARTPTEVMDTAGKVAGLCAQTGGC